MSMLPYLDLHSVMQQPTLSQGFPSHMRICKREFWQVAEQKSERVGYLLKSLSQIWWVRGPYCSVQSVSQVESVFVIKRKKTVSL